MLQPSAITALSPISARSPMTQWAPMLALDAMLATGTDHGAGVNAWRCRRCLGREQLGHAGKLRIGIVVHPEHRAGRRLEPFELTRTDQNAGLQKLLRRPPCSAGWRGTPGRMQWRYRAAPRHGSRSCHRLGRCRQSVRSDCEGSGREEEGHAACVHTLPDRFTWLKARAQVQATSCRQAGH